MSKNLKGKKGAKKYKENKFELFPIVREEILTLAEVKEKSGWSISAFNLPEVWKHCAGEGVVVAVVDCGCQLDHPCLANNLVPGKNFICPGKEPWDDSVLGHGTHVTGIICGQCGIGVAEKAKVMPVKVLDKYGSGNYEIVANGIRWAVDNGAEIICLSLGSPNPIQQVRKAIQYAHKRNIPVFVAAGNSGFTPDVFYPAAYPETIAIGSIGENFDRSQFSCTGKNLDFMAPGEKILSTVPKNWYAMLSGTSMATPWVAGIAALLLSAHKQNKLNFPLTTVRDYYEAFKAHTVPIKDQLEDKIFYQGFGIIDPQQLLEHLS